MSAKVPLLRVIVLVFVSLSLTEGCAPGGYLITPVPSQRKLVENEVIHEAWLAPKIALIDVEGVLVNGEKPGFLSRGEHAVSLLVEKLDRAAKDRSVKAVVLRINSPGGTVTASELMHYEITRFREQTGKPVIAVMMDVAASGGYYIACACDEIVAHRSTVTGSIGVVMQLFDVTGTLAKLGVQPNTIKSGDLKAGGSPFESLSEKNREIFQGIIDEMHRSFVNVVAARRSALNEDQVRALADGRIYTATQALEAGLIDRIGTMRDAVTVAKEKIGAAKANVVAYHRPIRYVPNYYARSSAGGDVNVVKIDLPAWLDRSTARFMYLWIP